MITRGTTPTVTFTLTDDSQTLDMSKYEKLFVTIEDGNGKQIELDKDRFVFNEDFSFDAKITQEETLALKSGRLKVQLRAKTIDDTVIASCVQYCTIEDILKKEII